MRFPGISAKLVRKCEITGIFHRCKIFLSFFASFCNAGGVTEVTSAELRPVGLFRSSHNSVHGTACPGHANWPMMRNSVEGSMKGPFFVVALSVVALFAAQPSLAQNA